MSTRATYEFQDDYNSFTIYKHHDGYPEGGVQWIANALPWAWPLPRFEADEFAAGFVRGNKDNSGGGIRITKSKDSHSDTEFHYVVTCPGKQLHIQVIELHTFSSSNKGNEKIVAEGTLEELLQQFAPERQWVKKVEAQRARSGN